MRVELPTERMNTLLSMRFSDVTLSMAACLMRKKHTTEMSPKSCQHAEKTFLGQTGLQRVAVPLRCHHCVERLEQLRIELQRLSEQIEGLHVNHIDPNQSGGTSRTTAENHMKTHHLQRFRIRFAVRIVFSRGGAAGGDLFDEHLQQAILRNELLVRGLRAPQERLHTRAEPEAVLRRRRLREQHPQHLHQQPRTLRVRISGQNLCAHTTAGECLCVRTAAHNLCVRTAAAQNLCVRSTVGNADRCELGARQQLFNARSIRKTQDTKPVQLFDNDGSALGISQVYLAE